MSINEKNLGRLEPVDLREIWVNESGDFTPWLAKEENLTLLGDTIGIELELEAQEKKVGAFKADMLCKDAATNDWVIIENQLECTDHCHLGQLLTYAVGLKAATIVWIAEQFTEEHRAALDWLNEITGDRFTFIGVEIELWRIGVSPIAPKFNVICKPNEYSKSVTETTIDQLTDTQKSYLEYWTGLSNVLLERKSDLKPRKPRTGKWYTFSIGRTNCWLYAGIDRKEDWITTGISLDSYFSLQSLEKEKEEIEKDLGFSLEWGNDENLWSGINKKNVDLSNRSDWPSQHLWLADKLEALHEAFLPRIRDIDVDEPEDSDGEQTILATKPSP